MNTKKSQMEETGAGRGARFRRTIALALTVVGLLLLSTAFAIRWSRADAATAQAKRISSQPNPGDPAAPQAGFDLWLPLVKQTTRAFDVTVDGFSFANYAGPGYAELTSVEMRRMYGDRVCASAVKQDGSCTLTPAAQRWMVNVNTYMLTGRCEGLAVLSLLMHNSLLKPQEYGAERASDLVLEGNEKLQREIAYWFATTMVTRTTTVKSSPNAVLAALRDSMSVNGSAMGTLRFSKLDKSGGHSVTPIRVEARAAGQVAITVYDSNYPQTTREMIINTATNTWFYSPEASISEDDYSGDAQSRTLGFAPIQPRLGQQVCSFCLTETPPAISAAGVLTVPPGFVGDVKMLMTNTDSSYTSYQGASGTTGHALVPGQGGAEKVTEEPTMPSSNQRNGQTSNLKSWEIQPNPYYTFATTETISFELKSRAGQTETFTTTITYLGPGFVFEVGELLLEEGQVDLLEIGPGGTVITYTTDSGGVPELFVGFEWPDADYGFSFFGFDMLPTDFVVLAIDAVNGLLDVRVDTIAPSGDVIFDFEMFRVDEESEEIFQSPEAGLDLRNDETLLIDFSAWSGGNSPLRVGYDANVNGLLDPEEEFAWEDAP